MVMFTVIIFLSDFSINEAQRTQQRVSTLKEFIEMLQKPRQPNDPTRYLETVGHD
jgi:hypothetical protein